MDDDDDGNGLAVYNSSSSTTKAAENIAPEAARTSGEKMVRMTADISTGMLILAAWLQLGAAAAGKMKLI